MFIVAELPKLRSRATNGRKRTVLCLGLWLVLGVAVAQSDLPPAVQADLLRNQIIAQAKANDADGVLVSLDQYHKLVDANKLEFPAPLSWIEAKAANDVGDSKRALAALTVFLRHADRGFAEYKQALALYPAYQQTAKSNDALERDAQRQAVIIRIPDVLRQMRENLVEIPEGQFTCPAKNFKCNEYDFRKSIKVKKFRITRCEPRLWWYVFAVDSGRMQKLPELDRSRYPREPSIDVCAQASSMFSSTNPMNDVMRPLVPASPSDLQAFMAWVSSHEGGKWRLPTEAELRLIVERYVTSSNGQIDPAGLSDFLLKVRLSVDLRGDVDRCAYAPELRELGIRPVYFLLSDRSEDASGCQMVEFLSRVNRSTILAVIFAKSSHLSTRETRGFCTFCWFEQT